MLRFNCVVVFSVLYLASFSALSDKVEVYTEHFPPYNYKYNGHMVGCSTRIVREVFSAAGIDYDIIEMPWGRALHSVKHNRNSFIYSISRTSSREDDFLWLGQIAEPKHVALALKSRKDILVSSISDFNHYRLGTSRNSAREQYLRLKGNKTAQMSRISSDTPNQINFELLRHGRVDIWLTEYRVARYIALINGYELNELLDIVFNFDELSNKGYYLAANKDSDKALLDKLHKAFLEVKGDLDTRMLDAGGLYCGD